MERARKKRLQRPSEAAGNKHLLSPSIERLMKPNIALLHQWGVRDIAQLCSHNPWVLTFNTERVKEILLRAEQLGVPPTSQMFRHTVVVTTCVSKEKVAAKLEFFKRTLGYSESQVSIAASKMPAILGLSDEIFLRKIEFLVNEVAMEPWYIVERPILVTMSLEKQLVPRHCVMKILQQKGLLNSNVSFSSLASYGEETFKSKFIDRHMDSVLELADAYAAARTSIVPSRV
jgi:mTERF domain-containing protein